MRQPESTARLAIFHTFFFALGGFLIAIMVRSGKVTRAYRVVRTFEALRIGWTGYASLTFTADSVQRSCYAISRQPAAAPP